MERSGIAPMEQVQAEKKKMRGRGKGSNFFALGKDVVDRLWKAKTTNRLNFVLVYLVLLAGTGSDHRLTKWSAKACEEHTGLGKPRAKHAIEELIAAGLVTRTAASTPMAPQYQLAELPREAEPIYLPVAFVTGLKGEASMLRRLRETGDAFALRMLIDLYGLISLDATYGIPIDCLRSGINEKEEPTARKMAEVGAHSVWALTEGTWMGGSGEWRSFHSSGTKSENDFWPRVNLLKQIGAIWFEPWAFDGEELDAEPLMPLDASGYYAVSMPSDEAKLTALALEASRALVTEDRNYLFDSTSADYYLPLIAHQRPPAFRRVARLKIEPDTPGRRLAWKRRRTLIEQRLQAYRQLTNDALEGHYDRPMQLARVQGENA